MKLFVLLGGFLMILLNCAMAIGLVAAIAMAARWVMTGELPVWLVG